MEKEELLESFFSLEGAIQIALDTYYQFLSNIKGKKLPPNKNIEYSSEHSEMNFDAFAKNENVAFTMRNIEHRRCIEGVVCPQAPLRVFSKRERFRM